jgi:hypothetical protein
MRIDVTPNKTKMWIGLITLYFQNRYKKTTKKIEAIIVLENKRNTEKVKVIKRFDLSVGFFQFLKIR